MCNSSVYHSLVFNEWNFFKKKDLNDFILPHYQSFHLKCSDRKSKGPIFFKEIDLFRLHFIPIEIVVMKTNLFDSTSRHNYSERFSIWYGPSVTHLSLCGRDSVILFGGESRVTDDSTSFHLSHNGLEDLKFSSTYRS